MDNCDELANNLFTLYKKPNILKGGMTRIDELNFAKIKPNIYVQGILDFSLKQAEANKIVKEDEKSGLSDLIPAQIYDSTISNSSKLKKMKIPRFLRQSKSKTDSGLDLILVDKAILRKRTTHSKTEADSGLDIKLVDKPTLRRRRANHI